MDGCDLTTFCKGYRVADLEASARQRLVAEKDKLAAGALEQQGTGAGPRVPQSTGGPGGGDAAPAGGRDGEVR